MEYLATFKADGYLLRLWDTNAIGNGYGALGKSRLAYTFGKEGERPVFIGSDFGSSPMHAIDSEETARALLGFLTLRKGDTDAEYFSDYTAEQIDFSESEAEALSLYAQEWPSDWPTVSDVADSLERLHASIVWDDVEPDHDCPFPDDCDIGSVDVRLCVQSGSKEKHGPGYGGWSLNEGDAGYDTDHRGFWGDGCLTVEDDRAAFESLACDLINEAAEQAAEDGEEYPPPFLHRIDEDPEPTFPDQDYIGAAQGEDS